MSLSTEPFSLAGQNALVVGGTRNLGRDIALVLADRGADVAVVGGKNAEALADTEKEIRDRGRRSVGVLADISHTEEVDRAFASAREEMGPFDILVVCAAIRPHGDYASIPVEEFDNVIATNLRAPFRFTQKALPEMQERGYGRILFFGGISMVWGKPGRPHVSASKMGLVGLTTGFASECALDGVTVNCLVPGFIDTDRSANAAWYGNLEEFYKKRTAMIPMGRLGQSEEIASTALFLLSREASYITGQTVNVTGGAIPLVRGS